MCHLLLSTQLVSKVRHTRTSHQHYLSPPPLRIINKKQGFRRPQMLQTRRTTSILILTYLQEFNQTKR